MTLHFAYGSNMDRTAMARRCPTAATIGPAVLEGYRFLITRDGYASVARTAGARVHGVLWRLTPRDLAALNAYEGVDGGLYTRAMLPVRNRDRRMTAMVYIGRAQDEGRPRPGYMEEVISAAREWNLPPDYVERLARWLPSGWSAARHTDAGDIA
jgi:gamma-glutamylcyclotransferase (GGCT)/AIG2-like uncharacterized protein YtfP